MQGEDAADCDYVVIGSGAGGGTVAARLAEAGMRVIVLEAGGDPLAAAEPGLPEDYNVPAFHSLASEHPALRWDFFVNHYADPAQQRLDPKCGPQGVLYPRAGTLGGCTAHNAMIFIAPHDSDWEAIADLTGDESWRAVNMRRYFEMIENCRYHPLWRLLGQNGLNATGHGWSGWLDTECALPRNILGDDELIQLVARSALVATLASGNPLRALWTLLRGEADPNGRRGGAATEGVYLTPLTTLGHHRHGSRERLVEVAARYPDRLRIELHALSTRVLFDANNRATGVEYRRGERLYRAVPNASDRDGTTCRITVRREVILAGGTFNSPQLLMLSGIGPAAELQRHGIDVRVDLPGVGCNLQDRYEIGVVNRMARDWRVLAGARFERGDRLYREWQKQRNGMYVTNGAAITVARRSEPQKSDPDLFLMALLARFRGYYPGYSRDIVEHHDYLTWAVLKAHTANRAGTVTLRSADPRDTPIVDFNYFDAADDPQGKDMQAVIAGIRMAREMVDALNMPDEVAAEELPGRQHQTDDDLAAYVRDNAWGHHASCSCAIGPRANNGVLNSDFKVHGTIGLRIVDASAFPRIPGFFIASAIYMIAEKAAETMLAEAPGR
ncbi:MAG TPA: GMC family oxidoreductase [Stellaceae bacterium]|jgi:choline dehydrogenase-like flavoprotein|nr:GMC family oxidoreductase [Stellaceae bacterium]